MKISGQTKPFAVLGHPIGHTFSPAMHNAAFAQTGRDAIYLALDVAPVRLMNILAALRDMGFGGVNLTVPLKEVAFRGLTRLDDSARRLGAVNTIEFQADGLLGHNTDGYGFLQAHQEAFGRSVQGAAVFVLGAGGAGRAVALTCAAAGARALTLSDLDVTRCHRVAEEVRERAPVCAVHVEPNIGGWSAAARAADLVVQATPVGSKAGDRPLLGPEAFRPGQRLLDLIYWFPQTAQMQAARTGGAQPVNGLGMLLHQGARAFEIWTGCAAPLAAMRAALEAEILSRQTAPAAL